MLASGSMVIAAPATLAWPSRISPLSPRNRAAPGLPGSKVSTVTGLALSSRLPTSIVAPAPTAQPPGL